MTDSTLSEIRVEPDTNPEPCSDQELIAAINRGDAASFETLYFRYRDWVVSLAARITGNPTAAIDVLQETFIYLFKKFPGFRLTAQMKTFLYPAVRNLSIAARVKAERYSATDLTLSEIEATPAPESLAGTDADLNYVLGRLPEEQREVLILRFVEGFSLDEIAEAMRIPTGTVKSRLHNALHTLRSDARIKELLNE
jgi:RNA polymerase sigma-70 factor (ECF subfamily)